MLVSIMMVTYNRWSLTQQTLLDLLKTTDQPFELIVVDNGSQDETPQLLPELLATHFSSHPLCQHYLFQANSANQGIAKARNQCLKLAQGEWLCTLDNDVLLPSGWLSQCVQICTHNPKFGMLGVNFEREQFPLVTLNGIEFQCKARGNLGTACMVFPRKLHKMLGYFNTEYGLYGEEDADYGFRARVAGFALGYIKEAGKHLGEGEQDVGPYREFKTQSHQKNLAKFNNNCKLYANKQKPIYLAYHE